MNVTFNASTIQKKYHCLTNKHYSWLYIKKKKKTMFMIFAFSELAWTKEIIYIYIYIYILTIFSHCISLSFIFHYYCGTLWLLSHSLITSHACLYLLFVSIYITNKSNRLSTQKKKKINRFIFTSLIHSLGTPIPFWNRILNKWGLYVFVFLSISLFVPEKEFIRYTTKISTYLNTKMSWF